MTTSKELYDRADELEAEVELLRQQAQALFRIERGAKPLADRLVYAAHERCPCGAGMAYDPCGEDASSPFKGPSAWDCSKIILGTADKNVTHTDKLPFAFYSIKAEGQPSAHGATTRPLPDADPTHPGDGS